jgi:hypothetical protein
MVHPRLPVRDSSQVDEIEAVALMPDPPGNAVSIVCYLQYSPLVTPAYPSFSFGVGVAELNFIFTLLLELEVLVTWDGELIALHLASFI